jgi:type II secretory pathway pseudopilin PulG
MMPCGSTASQRRRAFTLLEVTITALLLIIAMTVTLQVLGWVATERRAADRRQCALHEAANLMERVAGRRWDELTPETLRRITLSDEAKQALPGAELSMAAEESKEPAPARRISLRLRWRNRSGGWESPILLTAWAYRNGEHR